MTEVIFQQTSNEELVHTGNFQRISAEFCSGDLEEPCTRVIEVGKYLVVDNTLTLGISRADEWDSETENLVLFSNDPVKEDWTYEITGDVLTLNNADTSVQLFRVEESSCGIISGTLLGSP